MESISTQRVLRVLGTAFSSRDLLQQFICRTQALESSESFGSGCLKKTREGEGIKEKYLGSSAKARISSCTSSHYRDQICLPNDYLQNLRNEPAYQSKKSNQSLVISVQSFLGTEYPQCA